MLISKSDKNVLRAILLMISFSSGSSYNLDTQFPIIYSGSKGNYFGYSTALHHNRWGPVVLVGAPKSNTTTLNTTVHQPGTLFRCNISGNKAQQACEEVFLMKEGATEKVTRYGAEYTDMKDGMWLGVSLDVQPGPTENDIVTCGHLWKNIYHPKLHLVNGVCYVINGDLDNVRKLLPLTSTSRQFGHVRGRAQEYNHAHGQAGMSAVFSQNGSNLLLGAPGIWSWTGSIVNYNVKSPRRNVPYSNPVIPPPAYEINYNSYFGYSVTTGLFFQAKSEFYAAGAPRDGMNYGKVYIFAMERGQMRIRSKKQGLQLGEYFGASVLAVNLNGDSFTDLLVGAPMNSVESAGDEGKVYVYISNGNDLLGDSELTGDSKEGARFGTSLANIGDINQDGFNDIAVGAPYEDGTGAVYIYHGSRSGVNSGYAQKIEAAGINSQLSGFGIHVSRGLDIDDNGYPDILVGSYNSSNAVLLRSRPIIHVFPEIIFIPKQILMNQTSCQLRGQNVTCVQVDACLSYTGKHVPSSLAFLFTVTVKDSRGYFAQKAEKSSTTGEITVVLEINQKICSPFWVYLNPRIKDTIRPIPVEFSHQLVQPAVSKKQFDETFPIHHPSSLTNITSDITFMTGCVEEDECYSDLVVSVRRTEPAEGALITLGMISRVSVAITVINKGEPAYLSELLIYLPPEMPSINQDICEAGNQYNNASLVCHLGNPLENQAQSEINIKLDTTKIPPHTKYLQIACQVVSLSNETNPDDNTETLAFHLKTVSDIGVIGFQLQEQLLHNKTQTMSPTITHNYVVRNHGPSPLQKIDILLRVPYVFLTSDDQEPFVHFKSLEVDNGMPQTIPAVCEDVPLNIVNVQLARTDQGNKINDVPLLVKNDKKDTTSFVSNNDIVPPDDMTKNPQAKPLEVDKGHYGNETESPVTRGHFVISCAMQNIECITFRCSASPFIDQRKFAQLSIALELDFKILNKNLEQWYQIEFVTTASISVPDKAVTQLHHFPEEAQIKTTILHEGLPPPGKVAPWMIFGSIAIGVFLLLLILLIFIKIGFFKRKEKTKMKELLGNAEKNEETIEQDISDTEGLQPNEI